MDGSHDLPELVALAQTNAKKVEARIADLKDATPDCHAAIAELEAICIDIYSLFEARMQNTFKRGPFSRKLKALLIEAGQDDLAQRVHQSYLAVNVLKHGKGASYRELLATEAPMIVVRPSQATENGSRLGLIDVTTHGFFDSFSATILDAYHFLQDR